MNSFTVPLKSALRMLTLLLPVFLLACRATPGQPDIHESPGDTVSAGTASLQVTPITRQDERGTEMALVPAGEFLRMTYDEMTNQKSAATVYLADFYLDTTEVSNQQYATCVQAGACLEPANTTAFADPAFQDHPVIFVTWEMADTYCQWREARLPTQAEWEKAAADELAQTEYFWGDVSPVCQVGARLGAGPTSISGYDPLTTPVGTTTANRYGLYELTGGMWEWVSDPYAADLYETSPDTVSFLRMFRKSGYGPLYTRFLCSFRCAITP